MDFKGIIYVTQAQYDTLINGGSIVKDGVTYTYDDGYTYAVEGNFAEPPIIKTTLDTPCVPNTQYYLGTQSTVAITMPTNATVGQEILIVFANGATPATVTCDLTGFSFTPGANRTSWLKFTCTGTEAWICETKEG